MFCWHAYNLLSTSVVVLSNQALPLAGQPLTPSSLCDSCQSYIVNLTDYWTLHSWTLSLLSTPSTALPSGKHFAAKAYPTSYSIWSPPFMKTPMHVSGSDRNCRWEFPPPLVSGRVASQHPSYFVLPLAGQFSKCPLTPVSLSAPQHSLI